MRDGGSPSAKQERRRRWAATVKARARQAVVAVDRARARAASAIAPDPQAATARLAAAKAAAQGGETVVLDAPIVFTRRDTGAQIQVRSVVGDAEPGGFAVECLTHQMGPLKFDTLNAALDAARHSERWCPHCAGLALVKPGVRARARRQGGTAPAAG